MTHRHTNALIHETSPYLLQHAHNPVNWHPWGEEALRRARLAVVDVRGDSILKLTQSDYAEHRLSALVARYGSPGALNGEVFNALGSKIRGRSKLPRGKRIVCCRISGRP